MAIPSIYINLEDDVSKIVQRIHREKNSQMVLVCPKRSLLFADSINLRLLKKQVDLLGKVVFILTMDERGQMYAQEAGFSLKFLPKSSKGSGLSDVSFAPHEQLITGLEKNIKPQVTVGTKAEKKRIPKVASTAFVSSPILRSKQAVPPKLVVQNKEIDLGTKSNDEISEFKQKKYRNFFIGLLTVSLMVVSLIIFVVLPKATVAVYPKTEPITRDWEIHAVSDQKSIDSTSLSIPAKKVDEVVDVQDKFQSMGKKEVGNKASGFVRIYNFTKLPINLKANTTVLSIGNKNYLLKEDVLGIKPTTYKNIAEKEVDESSLSAPVAVIASIGGEGSNVPAGTRIEISNQVFGSKPQLLFAKSDSAITGGTSRFLSIVNESDIASAQNVLSDKILVQVRDKLKNDGYVIPNKAFTLQSLGFSTDKAIGTESPSFTGSLKVRITGLAFKNVELNSLIEQRVNQTLAGGKSLHVDADDIVNFDVKSIDMSSGTAVITVHFEGKAIPTINVADMADLLVGKSKDQVNEILRSRSEIEKIEIVLAPTWQKRFPLFSSKIHIQLENK